MRKTRTGHVRDAAAESRKANKNSASVYNSYQILLSNTEKSVLLTTFDCYRMLNFVYFDSDDMSLSLSLLDAWKGIEEGFQIFQIAISFWSGHKSKQAGSVWQPTRQEQLECRDVLRFLLNSTTQNLHNP